MIARIQGLIGAVYEHSVELTVGMISYEVLVAAADVKNLQTQVGQRVEFFTIDYLEGSPGHGALTPRLIGFLTATDRDFFQLFITVKGIGPRRALRAMVQPAARIAAAINARDTKFLTSLPEVGKRTAEQMIAELSGKLELGPEIAPAAEVSRTPEQERAIVGMVQLGEKRLDAQLLVDRACRADPSLADASTIMRAALRLKAGA
jgi:Holliday junction DNA helicase RuvA